jgi:hypothetical protein
VLGLAVGLVAAGLGEHMSVKTNECSRWLFKKIYRSNA